jgi:hypothetical protein
MFMVDSWTEHPEIGCAVTQSRRNGGKL